MRAEGPGGRPDTSVTARSSTSDGFTTNDDVEQLLPLSLSRPTVALTMARDVLSTRPEPRAASIAHQAVGIVLRDAGRPSDAVPELRSALRAARRCDDERVADVLATLGATLVLAGRIAAGLDRLDEALALAPRGSAGRLLVRRAHVRYHLGRYSEALADLRRAVSAFRRSHDDLWQARALLNRSVVYLAVGDLGQADQDSVSAERLFQHLGQRLEATYARHNQALTAHHQGDLPRALSLLDEVTSAYQDLEALPPDLAIDHAAALLTAGLAHEAREMVEQFLAHDDVAPTRLGEVLLVAARCALADGDDEAARRYASRARRRFRKEGRNRWAARAELLALQSRHLVVADHDPGGQHAARRPPRRSGPAAARLAEELLRQGAPEATEAFLLAGQLALQSGDRDEARWSLAVAARHRRTGPPLARAAGWLAAAILARDSAQHSSMLRACRRGLDAVDEHRDTLGDLEMRALASAHGLDLAKLALADVAATGTARQVLWWSDRWRATALDATPARPADRELARELAALRDVARRVTATTTSDAETTALRREQTRRETHVRRRYRALRGTRATSSGLDVATLVDRLGDVLMLCLVDVSGQLVAVEISRRRVRRTHVGPTASAVREAEMARFGLRRAAFGRPVKSTDMGQLLQRALVGERPWRWAAERVVVVPPPQLLTAPWGLLPVFADSALSVSPSATAWLTADADGIRQAGHVALVSGPGLRSEQAEVVGLSPLYRGATVLAGDEAAAPAVREAVQGARLAHLAAHGTFRPDAPMFSSVELADGPLTIHDLMGVSPPPRSVVLSACDSGGATTIGSEEVLGFVFGLLALRCSSVLASMVPVHDAATLAVMRDVHAVAGRAGSLATGLRVARQAAVGDPLRSATAAAFQVWGTC